MAESKDSRCNMDYTTETMTKLLQKYTDKIQDLQHFISHSEDASDDDSAKEDIGKVTTHLLEQGEYIKDCLNDQVQFNESWRNLGQTLESGLKLITESLDNIRPDPVQELCLIEKLTLVLCPFRIKLENYKDEVDARVEEIGKSISVGFFQKHKGALETRMSVLEPILAQLEDMKVLNTAERDEIQSKSTDNKKNEALLKILAKKGDAAQEKFCQILLKENPYLFEDLQKK